MNTFFQDLERGKEVERMVLKIIQKKYPCAKLSEGFQTYDIWIPEANQYVEVKYDPKSNETGNILLEFEMNGKPSALLTSTADWWVFYDDHEFRMFKKMELVNFIFQNKLVYGTIVGKGDTVSKKVFFTKKKDLFPLGRILK